MDARRATGRGARTLAVALTAGLLLAGAVACSSDDDAGTDAGTTTTEAGSGATEPITACDPTIDESEFTSADELHDLVAELNENGLRSPGSDAHEATMDRLEEQFAAVPGMVVETETYPMQRWQPTPEAEDGTGRDLAAAGGLRVGGEDVPVAGAVPFSVPTDEEGASAPMVFVGPDEEITAANASGRVVVTWVAPVSIPYGVFSAIGHHLTPDLPTEGDYDRPYLRNTDGVLTDAGLAGAVGVVFLWEVPTDQILGYWQPHSGTRHHVSAVFVGSDEATEVEAAARAGEDASVVVRAEWDDTEARNIIATLPGASEERIVVNTHTDGVTWVQENGAAGALALARYLARLPEGCRERTVQFALTANHLGYEADGTFPYGEQLDEDFDEGTVAFVVSMEHLGSTEVLPGDDGRLELTGETDLFAWVAPQESEALVQASIDAVERREVRRTAILKGVEAPVDGRLPPFCSQGGLGSNFNGLLIPSIGAISGPWTLWTNAFGEDAIDAEHMRSQVLALGDVVRSLDATPRDEIAGDYLAMREARAEGGTVCDIPHPPTVAPEP
jgi:hypothetical protein